MDFLVFDESILKTLCTILATFLSTLLAVAKWIKQPIRELNCRIDELSKSIVSLDKNLAVQSALFDNHLKKEEQNGRNYRN